MNKQEVYQNLEQNNIEYEAVEHNIVDDICESAKPTDNNGTIPADEQPVINSITIKEA